MELSLAGSLDNDAHGFSSTWVVIVVDGKASLPASVVEADGAVPVATAGSVVGISGCDSAGGAPT